MLILILGAGLFLTVGLRFLTIMKIPLGFSLLWKGRIPGNDAGDITPFDALMTSLASLEKEVGVGNKRVFRRAVAVLQLHLGALVSGQAEDDGLDTIDHRQPVFEARLGKYPSARLCLRAIGFTKRRGVYSHAGVRGAAW